MAKVEINSLDRALGRARRRTLVARTLTNTGRVLVLTGGLALPLIVASRLMGVDVHWIVVAGLVAFGVCLGVGLAFYHRRGRLAHAIALDHALHLRDALGSAVALGSERSAFAELVSREAKARASDLDWKRAMPLRIPRTIWVGALLSMSSVAAAKFVPVGLPPSAAERAALIQRQEQRRAAADQLAAAGESLRKTQLEDAQGLDPLQERREEQRVLETLERLAGQLDPEGEAETIPERGDGDDPEETIAQAAGELNALADELEQQAVANERVNRSLRETLDGLPRGEGEDAADALIESLSRGEFEETGRQAESLAEQMAQADQEQRRRSAERLREAAQALEQASQREREELDAQRQRDREALKQQGIDEQQQDGWNEQSPSAEELNEQLREAGHSTEEAQRLAEQWRERLEEQAAKDQAHEESQQLAEEMERLADAIDESPSEEDSSSPSNEQNPNESSELEQSDESQSSQEESQPSPESEQGEQSTREPGEESQQQKSREIQPEERGDEQRSTDPGSEQRESEQGAGEQRESAEPGQSPSPDQELDESVKRMQETLRRLDRMPKDAQRQGELSQEMRKQAEELAKRLSPEEKKQLERWARQQSENPEMPTGRPNSNDDATAPRTPGLTKGEPMTPGRDENEASGPPMGTTTEDRLVRPESEAWENQTIEEWYPSDEESGETAQPRSGSSGAPLRRAASATEKALSEDRIAPRFRDLIRRWADRLEEDAASEESKPEAENP